MGPKSAVGQSSAQPTRVSSRVKSGPKFLTQDPLPVAKATTGKRKAVESLDAPPSKKSIKATARKPTASKPAAKPAKKPAATSRKTSTAKPSKVVNAAPAKRGRASATIPKASAGKRKAAEPLDEPISKKRVTAAASKAAAAKPAAKPRKTLTAKAPSKRARASTTVKQPVAPKPLPIINTAPTEKLDVFVMGQGESGELGLGTTRRDTGVKRPRLHPQLSTGNTDIVYLAPGGMHAAVLTHNNEILTWGVNDDGACGRDTAWKAPDASPEDDDESDDPDSDIGLNPKEANPIAIPAECFPTGTKFVQLASGDSCTFALTAEGLVYGWGTFRDNNGILGFSPDIEIAREPVRIPELKNIKHIACGNNHALALDAAGDVFIWGAGEQNQLGRRIVQRNRLSCLTPRAMALPKKQIQYIASGGEFSFAIAKNGKVYSWGLNNFGQTGIPENAGESDASISAPTIVKQLNGYEFDMIKGGAHHSLAVTKDGTCLVWGRADGGQIGIDTDSLQEESVMRVNGKVALLLKPTAMPDLKCKYATTASDHSIAITTAGKAYSWGFNGLHQAGQGHGEDIKTATLIDNTAVRGRNLNWAGTGGQYSMLTSLHSSQNTNTTPNGPTTTTAAELPQQPTPGAVAVNGSPNTSSEKSTLEGESSPIKEEAKSKPDEYDINGNNVMMTNGL